MGLISAISTAQYRHGIFDFLLACAVDDEFVDRNEAVVVEIHRFEYSLHVQFGIIIPRSVPSHQLMDRVHNLVVGQKEKYKLSGTIHSWEILLRYFFSFE